MGPFPFASECSACFASVTGWRARRDERDHFYGFGETTGELNKRGRKFRLSPKDAIGHDAGWGDPLYKQAAYTQLVFAVTLHTRPIAAACADPILCAHE